MVVSIESLFVFLGIYLLLCWSMYLPLAAGQLFIAQMGLATIGGYIAGVATKAGIPFAAALVISASGTALIGLALGYPALKAKRYVLCIITLGFSEIVKVFFMNFDAVGGSYGLRGIPLYGNLYYVGLTVFIVLIFLHRLSSTRLGRAIAAIRNDEEAAQAMGVNSRNVKLLVYALSGFVAALGGALWVHYSSYIDPFLFSFKVLLFVFTFVVFGGRTVLWGSVFGTVVLWSLPEFTRFMVEWREIFYSLVLVVVLLYRPQGVITESTLSAIPLRQWLMRWKPLKARFSQRG